MSHPCFTNDHLKLYYVLNIMQNFNKYTLLVYEYLQQRKITTLLFTWHGLFFGNIWNITQTNIFTKYNEISIVVGLEDEQQYL